jgi:septum formation protein
VTHVTSPTVILASGSPRRRELLKTLGIPFEVDVSKVDETVSEPLAPGPFVEAMAMRKALEVAERRATTQREGLVVGADTVVVLDGAILGKPTSKVHAVEMLSRLQGRKHEVYTGLCVVRLSDMETLTGHSRTEVTMRPLSLGQIQKYVASGEPMDKAGAYAIQGLGSTLVTRIEGDYFTVVGLPVYLLSDYLRHFGVDILDSQPER